MKSRHIFGYIVISSICLMVMALVFASNQIDPLWIAWVVFVMSASLGASLAAIGLGITVLLHCVGVQKSAPTQPGNPFPEIGI